MRTLIRHLLAILLLIVLIGLFALGRPGLHPLHFWNRIIADASFVLLCLTLALGPLVKFVPRLRFLLPWRRELGIAFTVSASLHVAIYTSNFNWNFLRFFATAGKEGGIKWLNNAFAIANWTGLIALLYALILTLTSNDFTQRYLGRGWKFLQQQSYTLFVLVLLHTAIFLYLVFDEREDAIRPLFIVVAFFALILQAAGYLYTVRLQRRRRRPGAEQR